MIRKPICEEIDAARYNTSNEHAYDPYVLDESAVLIDEAWWASLTAYCQRLIRARLNDRYRLGRVAVPHAVERHADLELVYQATIDSFDYQHWGVPLAPVGTRLLALNDRVKKTLLARYLGEPEAPTDRRDLARLAARITEGMLPGGYFVRLSSTSGKNVRAPEPFNNAQQIVRHLTTMRPFATREYARDKETVLVLVPWNDAITARNEFRLFVVDRRITGASPQRCFEYHHYSAEELEAVEEALATTTLPRESPYATFVADVWIDFAARECHLIELNVFGAHSGAGSSLFNWIDDWDVLHGTAPAELRYRAVIDF
jgi:hypothetical protein